MINFYCYIIFFIPILFILNCWYIYQVVMFCFLKSYFCSIGYIIAMDIYSFGLIILTLLISCLMVISSRNTCIINFSFYLFLNLVLCLFLVFIFLLLIFVGFCLFSIVLFDFFLIFGSFTVSFVYFSVMYSV